MNEIKKTEEKEDKLAEIEISKKFLEEYQKLCEKYQRDLSPQIQLKIVKIEKI